MNDCFGRIICVDLRCFDSRMPDYGIARYLESLGFIPDELCLLNFHVMFLWAFDKVDDSVLDPLNIGQNGTPCECPWTMRNLHDLIAALKKRGIRVSMGILANTISAVWKNTNYVWPYEETLQKTRGGKNLWGNAVNILKRMKSGEYFEDVFIDRLERVLCAFDLDGYVAGDGMLGLRGPRETLVDTDFSSDMVDQFLAYSSISMPSFEEYDDRADYIVANLYPEWVDFWTWRWARHVGKVSRMLSSHGFSFGAIDSWSRNPEDLKRQFGIDYRLLHENGLEMVYVQARETNKWRKHREGEYVREQNNVYTFLAHKAYAPGLRYYWAQATVNVPEFWNTMLDLPNVSERECYAYLWTSTYHDGRWVGSCDGVYVIWGDDMRNEDWKWLDARWTQARGLFVGYRRPLGVTVVFSDSSVGSSYSRDGELFARLLDAGVCIQSSVNEKEVDGKFLDENPDLFLLSFDPSFTSRFPMANGRTFVVENGSISFYGLRYGWTAGVEMIKEKCHVKTTKGRVLGFENVNGEYVVSLENPDNLFYEKVYVAMDRVIEDLKVLPPRSWYSIPHSSDGGSTALSIPPDASLQIVSRFSSSKRNIPLEFHEKELGI